MKIHRSNDRRSNDRRTGDRRDDATVEIAVILHGGELYCPTCWYGPRGIFGLAERTELTEYATGDRWPMLSGAARCCVCGHGPEEPMAVREAAAVSRMLRRALAICDVEDAATLMLFAVGIVVGLTIGL